MTLNVKAATALFALTSIGFAQAQPVDQSVLSGMVWRNIGPFRGGRVSAVSGAIGQTGVFYMGLPQGGLWKTTSAGQTWFPIFDSVRDTPVIGSIAVAPSNPNVIYAGTGEISGNNEGFGVYKSVDAGKTWLHQGLTETRQIPTILVDPHDPNLAVLAAEGDQRKHTEERGVFRTTDGGKTWSPAIFIDNETGIAHMAWASDHPEIILATSVRRYAPPGNLPSFNFGPGQGPNGTALYKSTDEGQTWKPVVGKGLPKLFGRCTVAVAMNTNAQRMFIIGMFGLYRSDDGGSTWRQMASKDARIANGQGNYTSGVYVDPQNPDIVYTLATCAYRSLDGGETFTGFKGAPGGDDPQQMWIDPTNGSRILLGGDQGATVSLDAGATWGSWYNQPTAQIYHISTDNQYPYWVYGSQQDSGSIATASRGNLGAITPMDWLPHPGYEFGSVVADPLNPNISFAGGPDSGIVKTTYPSGQWINVSPNLDPDENLRQIRTQPMAFSPSNPRELMVGFQYLMSTTDGGLHWKKLSPDLGLRPEVPVPKEADNFFTRRFNPRLGSVECFSQSDVKPDVIWVGTSNGMVKLTRDHGANWEDVSIPGLANPMREEIAGVDASHQDAGTAYVAISNRLMGDDNPYFFRTHDYGKTWTKIVDGMATGEPNGSFGRVIRTDTKRAGLLFAGTESAMYVSFDDGDHWQSVQLNLPTTSFRDINVHGNDLVVGTYGRGFWILDDFSPLREMVQTTGSESAHLFKPGDAIRVRRNVNGDTPFPPEVPHALNPPLGAVIYYSLSSKPAGPISLDILDSSGKVVRHMSSEPIAPYPDPEPAVPNFWAEVRKPLPIEIGLNRVNWNVRFDDPPAFVHDVQEDMQSMAYDTPAGTEGPMVLPGTYAVRLTVDGKSYTQEVTVKNDPRSPARPAELKAQFELQKNLLDASRAAKEGYDQVAALRAALDPALHSGVADVEAAAKSVDSKLAAIGGRASFVRRFFAAQGEPTFVTVNGSFVHQLDTLDKGDMAPGEPAVGAYVVSRNQMVSLLAKWRSFNEKDLVELNALLAKNGLKPLVAASAPADPTGPPSWYRKRPSQAAASAKPSGAGNVQGVETAPEDEEGD